MKRMTAYRLGLLGFFAATCLLPTACNLPDVAGLWVPEDAPPPELAPVTVEQPADADEAAATDDGADIDAAPTGPLVLSIRNAALAALRRNPDFQVQRLEPALSHAAMMRQRAVFDPTLSAEVSIKREDADAETEQGAAVTEVETDEEVRTGKAGLQQTLPTGASISLQGQRVLDETDGEPQRTPDTRDFTGTNTYDLTVTQSLLEGRGPAVNLARLRQTRLDLRISRHVLKGAAESLVYQTESAGWDYILARRQIAIYEESLKVAQNQADEVRERIRVGDLADIELASVNAEVAKRREELINARSSLAKTRLKLLRLLGGSGDGWTREITLTDTPVAPTDALAPLEDHVELALRQRPDLNEARLRLQRGELDIVRTRNGLLPKLDFFITLGGTRYAGSFSANQREEEKDADNVTAGLRFEYALGGRSDRAAHRQSVLSVRQARQALQNQEDLAQVDVRTAYLEIQRTAEQIEATRATREHREEALRAETEKFRVGKSTGILVTQAQRDLVASRISEVEAVVQHIKARLNLYQVEGSLLDRRGIRLDE